MRETPHVVIAKRLGVSHVTVGKWRRRYHDQGVAGLHDEQRPGRPRTHADERVAEVLNTALQGPPPTASHWSVAPGLAALAGIGGNPVDLLGLVLLHREQGGHLAEGGAQGHGKQHRRQLDAMIQPGPQPRGFQIQNQQSCGHRWCGNRHRLAGPSV
ncbi:MAG: helix-turn-helix domain-containing protein [Synechococcus sp. SB0678_bin_12]|nr:helix-turn-helix domain-containing protein [Synechococcus sp. SB0678_bin_12]MYI87958.1 helix-turn-helix domain-containing protein [Synechococcus sp. SB0672_bin_10]